MPHKLGSKKKQAIKSPRHHLRSFLAFFDQVDTGWTSPSWSPKILLGPACRATRTGWGGGECTTKNADFGGEGGESGVHLRTPQLHPKTQHNHPIRIPSEPAPLSLATLHGRGAAGRDPRGCGMSRGVGERHRRRETNWGRFRRWRPGVTKGPPMSARR